MRKILIPILFSVILLNGCLSTPSYTGHDQSISSDQNSLNNTFEFGQFSIPAGAELLESTEFKNDGIPYMVEKRYKLPSGQIMYAYYDVEGSSSVTIQRIEDAPLLALGTDVNIPGMPGYREFNFGDDRRKLVQFMKLFKLGQKDYSRKVKTPSLSDHIFSSVASWKSEFILLLDLLDETWVLEHRQYSGNRLTSTDTTAITHTNKYAD